MWKGGVTIWFPGCLLQLTFKFEKRCQLLVGTNDKPLSVVAVGVCREKHATSRFSNVSRAPKCAVNVSWNHGQTRLQAAKPGHRKFVYPVIDAVTGPILTFAAPAFFGT
jgi:hypothetical protein